MSKTILVATSVTVLVTINVLKKATQYITQLAAEVLRESTATSISTQLMEGIGGTSGGRVSR